MSELNITEVNLENFSETVTKYISDKCIKITDIDSMIETYLSMLGDHYLFKFDRDLLKDMLVDLTYMYSPNDDANKDRVLYHLVGSDDDDDDSDDGADMMQKLSEQLMSQMPNNTNINENVHEENVQEESVHQNVYASEGK
tara:strand:- start:467 stop:889 length:423 start_codon:yes stop_codon:yes gene_type:complete